MRLPNICGLLTASALLIGANSANALELTIDDLNAGASPEVTLGDGGTGVINYDSNDDGAVGSFSVVISTGVGAPVIGNGPNEAEIDLSVQASSSGVGTLQVALTDTGLSLADTGPTGTTAALSRFSINANSEGSSATVESFIRVGGGSFEALSSLTGDGDINLVETIRGVLGSGVLFDLRTVITLSYEKLGFATADANLSVAPVPLPAALPLFLTALVGLGFVGRQRRRQAA